MTEAGLFDALFRKYMVGYYIDQILFIRVAFLLNIVFIYQPRIDQCRIENQVASARAKRLTLVDMSSAFVVLGLGISLSILIFLLELVYKRIQYHFFG